MDERTLSGRQCVQYGAPLSAALTALHEKEASSAEPALLSQSLPAGCS